MARFRYRSRPVRRVKDVVPEIKTHAQQELEAMDAGDPPVDDDGLHYSCTGCVWALLVFLVMMGLALVLNKCSS